MYRQKHIRYTEAIARDVSRCFISYEVMNICLPTLTKMFLILHINFFQSCSIQILISLSISQIVAPLYLQIRLVRSEPASPDFTQSFEHAHSVYHSYQMKIHMDPPEKPNVKQYTRFLCNSPLQVTIAYWGSFHFSDEVGEG